MKMTKKEILKVERTVLEKQTGVLWHDRDDGYMLETVVPGVHFRIKDLLRGHEGKEIRITIEGLARKGSCTLKRK